MYRKSNISMRKAPSICDMRGFLSFLILWLLRKKPMSGAQLASEIEERKGCKPNPGTIYPALKELLSKKAIFIERQEGKEKIYALTPMGKGQLVHAKHAFCKTFHDLFAQ